MIEVIFTGWGDCLHKIELNRLLRARANLSLGVAKDVVDRVLKKEEVTILVPTYEEAYELVRAAREIGAECAVAGEAQIVRERSTPGE